MTTTDTTPPTPPTAPPVRPEPAQRVLGHSGLRLFEHPRGLWVERDGRLVLNLVEASDEERAEVRRIVEGR